MRIIKLTLFLVFSLSAIGLIIASCLGIERIYRSELTPSRLLVSQKWKTTKILDPEGHNIISEPQKLSGTTEYKSNGTYVIRSLDGSVRAIGDWSITEDGKKGIWIEKKEDHSDKVRSTDVVDIIKLTPSLFIYSINVNGQKLTVEHIPL
ncbi:DUF4822 domain-containing protein [Chryseobacterium sp. MYb264]|uniref:DUF4822 domain-containing protein n=1 Tax=Chryseobacterium sp. MYb264 TaxID=2745153 RepID=UPI002E0FD393|nr:DUF4822 domain-containing protein [Chryseobacterium sp. MYb264]